MRAPEIVVHEGGGADDLALAVSVRGEVLEESVVGVIDLRDLAHEARVLAELLQQAHRLVDKDGADAVVEPALGVELHGLGLPDEELVERAAEGDVIVPGGAGCRRGA